MIKVNSLLQIADNSGALTVACLNVPRLRKSNGATVGDIVTTTVKINVFKKNIIKKSKIISKSQIVDSIIITVSAPIKRWGHFYIKSNINSAILLNQYQLPYGTRLFGFLFREIRQKTKFRKVVSLAKFLI